MLSSFCVFFFFFKQKTAYEMPISDWSSDVCSSDLERDRAVGDAVRDKDIVTLEQRAAAIDDVGDIAFAILIGGGEDRLAGAADHLRGIVLVEQHRADRIFAHRADAVGEQQPALVKLAWRPARSEEHTSELPSL